jgi:hypothetical protein
MFEIDNQLMHKKYQFTWILYGHFFPYTLIHALFPLRLLPLHTSHDKISASLVVSMAFFRGVHDAK